MSDKELFEKLIKNKKEYHRRYGSTVSQKLERIIDLLEEIKNGIKN